MALKEWFNPDLLRWARIKARENLHLEPTKKADPKLALNHDEMRSIDHSIKLRSLVACSCKVMPTHSLFAMTEWILRGAWLS
jgi:hypothetical protein